jgi:hypothetical protein
LDRLDEVTSSTILLWVLGNYVVEFNEADSVVVSMRTLGSSLLRKSITRNQSLAIDVHIDSFFLKNDYKFETNSEERIDKSELG